jgi:hypothetical protein
MSGGLASLWVSARCQQLALFLVKMALGMVALA